MRTYSIIAWLLVCLAALTGCQNDDEPVLDQTGEVLSLRDEVRKLQREVDRLKADEVELKGREDDAAKRAERISDLLREAKLRNARLTEQIETLGGLPAERDRYKAEAEKLRKRVIELELLLRERTPKPTPTKTP